MLAFPPTLTRICERIAEVAALEFPPPRKAPAPEPDTIQKFLPALTVISPVREILRFAEANPIEAIELPKDWIETSLPADTTIFPEIGPVAEEYPGFLPITALLKFPDIGLVVTITSNPAFTVISPVLVTPTAQAVPVGPMAAGLNGEAAGHETLTEPKGAVTSTAPITLPI